MLYFATPVSEIKYEHKYQLVRLTLINRLIVYLGVL